MLLAVAEGGACDGSPMNCFSRDAVGHSENFGILADKVRAVFAVVILEFSDLIPPPTPDTFLKRFEEV